MSNKLIDALIIKYQGEVEVAKANIDILLNHPNGVADHPDMAATLDELVKKLSDAEEQLNTLTSLQDQDEQELLT